MADKPKELITPNEKLAQAKDLYARGSRSFLLNSYNDAADDLSQVCKLYEEIYGSNADELGMPYLLYAKSLIVLAQDENKVIDVPDEEEDGDDDDGGDEDEGDGEEENNEAVAEKTEEEKEAETTAKENENKSETGEEKMDTANAEEDTDSNPVPDSAGDVQSGRNENGKKSEDAPKANGTVKDEPSTSNGHKDEENVGADGNDDDDEATTNLQVAWETLELAAKIFQNQGETALPNLADTYAELAGISFENSHFEAAINDYERALEIHIKLPEDNRRIIAEIHYKIGLAHLMLNDFDKCVSELKRASDLIEQEIDEEKTKSDETERSIELIKDLEDTKQDILAKITEVEETKQQSTEEVKRELSRVIGNQPSSSSDGAGPSSSTDQPKATDISHLIKRKKTEASDSEASPAKRSAP